jgi:nucleotide-binding universal stress UspA family protein
MEHVTADIRKTPLEARTTPLEATQATPPQDEQFRRVLVPLDGSAQAERALAPAMRLARPLGLEIVIVRVVRPIVTTGAEGTGRIPTNVVETLREEAESYLAEVVRRYDDGDVRLTTSLRFGDPAAEVAEAAREREADLIAMSAHGRTGVGRLLFGSVAQEVLRTASVPVLLVRATESATDAARAA